MIKISVVIPTYNRAGVLPRAIDSVLNQTYDNYEIVIADDGSTDNTREVVQSYEFDRINYIRHESNKGQNVTRNTGITNAKGKYISYLDSDDVLFKNHLKVVVDKLDSLSEEFAGVYTGRQTDHGDYLVTNEVHEGELTLEELFRSGNAYQHIAGSISLTFRNKIIEDVGLHDESVTAGTDLDYFIEILKKYKLYGINQPLCKAFKQADSVSIDTKKVIQGEKRLVNKHGHILNSATKARRFYNIGIAYAAQKNITKAKNYLFRSIRADFTEPAPYYHLVLCALGFRMFKKFNKTGFEISTNNKNDGR